MQYLVDIEKQNYSVIFNGSVTPPEMGSTSDSMDKLLNNIVGGAYFSTGLLPLNGSGVLSIQKSLGYMQITMQLEPAIRKVKWGYRENDPDAKIYELAFPYYVIVMDFLKDSMLGARHFFSPEPITSWSQPLYAVNLPNTNTLGYNGTSLGWICLYHTRNTPFESIAERVEYMLTRMHGVGEPYNDRNMDETDGARFYQSRNKPAYMWNPAEWQKKTYAEGTDWINNPDELIMLRALDDDTHYQQYNSAGTPYTLYKATHMPYSAYYSDEMYVKPFMVETTAAHIETLFTDSAFKLTKPESEDVAKKLKAQLSQITTNHLASYSNVLKGNLIHCDCCEKDYVETTIDFYDVITSYSYIDNVLTADNTQNWCESCFYDYAGSIYVPQMNINGSFNTDLLLWSESQDCWLLPETSWTCPHCSLLCLLADKNDIAVYQAADSEPTQCVDCATNIGWCEVTQHYYILEALSEVSINDYASSIGAQLKYVVSTHKHLVCKCGILHTNAPEYANENICASCVNSLGEYTPLLGVTTNVSIANVANTSAN